MPHPETQPVAGETRHLQCGGGNKKQFTEFRDKHEGPSLLFSKQLLPVCSSAWWRNVGLVITHLVSCCLCFLVCFAGSPLLCASVGLQHERLGSSRRVLPSVRSAIQWVFSLQILFTAVRSPDSSAFFFLFFSVCLHRQLKHFNLSGKLRPVTAVRAHTAEFTSDWAVWRKTAQGACGTVVSQCGAKGNYAADADCWLKPQKKGK